MEEDKAKIVIVSRDMKGILNLTMYNLHHLL